jgi:hypothetical protein
MFEENSMTSSVYTGVSGNKYGIGRPHIRVMEHSVIVTMYSGVCYFDSSVLRKSMVEEHGFKDTVSLKMQYALLHNHMATFRELLRMWQAMYAN